MTSADRVVRLRPVQDSDLPELFAQQADPESNRMAAVASRDRAAFDAHWARLLPDPSLHLRAVLVDDDVAGHVTCFGEPDDRQLGYWLARRYWGQGVATVAVGLLLDEVAHRPLHATVAVHNTASRRVLQRHGFTATGRRTGDDGVELLLLRLDACAGPAPGNAAPMTTPSEDLLATTEGVDEGSAASTDEGRAGHEPSTEELTGVTNPLARALGDDDASRPQSEATPAPPVGTGEPDDVAGPGQQLEAGEG